jgi:sigma-E factor negative regulatory protein RseB
MESMRPPRHQPLANSITRSWAYGALMLALVLPAFSRGAGAASGVRADKPSSAVSEDARTWLTRTDEALARRNYRGVFVHELHGYGGEAETLEVIHRVGSDGVSERLLSMDGSGREFIRRNGQLSCYLPDQRTVLVLKSAQPTLPLNVPQLDSQWSEHYDVRQVEMTRVSGHRVRVIAVTPLDALRYGYRVWIDDATAMPLKTQLRDSRGTVLEQILFTQLKLPTHIADADLRPAIDARGYRWVRQQEASAPRTLPAAATVPLPLAWQVGSLPSGFHMTASGLQTFSSGPAQHLVFSDGLASVSVFIQPARTGGNVHFEEAATLGTSSAYSTLVSGYRITAVGEVPPQTVREIVQSIRSTSPGADATGEAATAEISSSPLGTVDVNGAGRLLIIGNLGNGNLGAAQGIDEEQRSGPYRSDATVPIAGTTAAPR